MKAFFFIFFMALLLSLPLHACEEKLNSILDYTTLRSGDWRLAELTHLQKECSDNSYVAYWKAVGLIDENRPLLAIRELDHLISGLGQLVPDHWLHVWAKVRKGEAFYLNNLITAEDYLKLREEYKDNADIVSFVEQTLSLKVVFPKLASDLDRGNVYRGALVHLSHVDADTAAEFKRQIDEIWVNIPSLRESLANTQIIVARDADQYREWLNYPAEGAVMNNTPAWAKRIFVMVIDAQFIRERNITLVHELMHVLMAIHPTLREMALDFRHRMGHYRFPQNDSEHLVVYAAQYYLTGYAEYYRQHWPAMFSLLSHFFGAQTVNSKGTDVSMVDYAVQRDLVNF